MRIQVELGFILQAGTCQILNFPKNPRQSQSGGKHRTEKSYTGRGDTAHTLLTRVTHEVGTPHNIERWEGDTAHTLLMRNNWGGDTAQYRKTSSAGSAGRYKLS